MNLKLLIFLLLFQKHQKQIVKILEQPPLTEDESKELFAEVASRLEISEDELMKFHEMPECTEKFKSQEKLYNFGIRLYEKLGLEKRIRK